ncbi:MAG: hypothetical protein CM15mP88_1410 [Pseudomonadota bacterium]|nr:MAG: hypothetical protein CM15mP88_1410 [Pseudomonadota bacterium]
MILKTIYQLKDLVLLVYVCCNLVLLLVVLICRRSLFFLAQFKETVCPISLFIPTPNLNPSKVCSTVFQLKIQIELKDSTSLLTTNVANNFPLSNLYVVVHKELNVSTSAVPLLVPEVVVQNLLKRLCVVDLLSNSASNGIKSSPQLNHYLISFKKY